MLTTAVDSYLAMRRVLGYRLKDTEAILRDFATFADAKHDSHVYTQTVLEWIWGGERQPVKKLCSVADHCALCALPPCR